jgi:hypothetical protein
MNCNNASQCKKYLTAFVAASLFTSHASQAETWDTFMPQPAVETFGIQALIDPFAIDPANPAIFVGAGNGAILRMEPVDTMSYTTTQVDGNLGTVTRLGFSPADSSVYAVGSRWSGTSQTGQSVWTVRQSTFNPGTQTWSTWSDAGSGSTFAFNTKDGSQVVGVAADPLGNIYAGGFAWVKNTQHWIVRRKPASGGAWATISDLSYRGNSSAGAAYYFPGNPAQNLAPGLLAGGMLNNQWVIRRLDSNGSWATVDSPSLAGAVNTISSDANGNLFAVGFRGGGLAGMPYGWVIRMSTSGGGAGSWFTVLDVSEGYFSTTSSVAADASGNIWVTGYTGTTMDIQTSQPRWTVLKNSPGQLWTDSWSQRQFQFANATNSRARGLSTDAYGHVFITGHVTDWTDGITTIPGSHAVVQRLAP